MTESEHDALARSFSAALDFRLRDPLDDAPVPEPIERRLTIALRKEAADVLDHLSEHFATPPETIAENVLASRLKTVGARLRRRGHLR
jgi:hypothetical protein